MRTDRQRFKMLAISRLGIFLAFLASLGLGQSPSQSGKEPSSPASVASNKKGAPSSVPSRDLFVGDAACAQCHREKVDSFRQTAHYLTSRLPTKDSILGNFAPGANSITTSNPDLSFRMDEKQNGFFQTAVQGIAPYTIERSERFDFVVGSGGKGQTYLYWKGDELFQLPVSYWAELGWVNSPGYRDGVANFDRPILPRCLECHATYFESKSPPSNRYAKTEYVLGITCEKCHGPGRKHIEVETSNIHDASNLAILNPAKFPRDRQLDLCAWCHAGQGVGREPTFSYVPGEALNKYLDLPQADPTAPIDVHGSQVELLERSKCFQSSAMTCLTCHDVHSGPHSPAAFTQRCLDCHKPGAPMFPKLNHRADSTCIDCHMPNQNTDLIVFDWHGKKVRPQVRSHWIKTYSPPPSN
jgi:Cytochrome c554 and c-prime